MHRIWFERQPPAPVAAMLAGLAEIAGPASATPDAPLSGLPGAHAAVAGARLSYDGALMDRSPALRVISRTGIGVDNIDLAAASARGIAVCNAPDAPSQSTAEHTIALMLAAVKQLKQAEDMLRRRTAADFFNAYQGMEVRGRCLAVIGLGRIGRRVAEMARGLGMRVIGFDPLLAPAEAAALGVALAQSVEAALAEADVVSLHTPLTPETRHLINAQRLALMKPGAYLINTARGPLVDEAALLAALDSGHLAGAGLDVFEHEPPAQDHPLLLRANVLATPHIAGATVASKDRLWQAAIGQILQALRGERPAHLVNPDAWPPLETRT